MKLYQLFDELQGHESNVAQTIRELSGGPLALVSSFESSIPNPPAPEPYKPTVPLAQSSLTSLPTHIYPGDDSETSDSELRFQEECSAFNEIQTSFQSIL